jgi:hypothetical protein
MLKRIVKTYDKATYSGHGYTQSSFYHADIGDEILKEQTFLQDNIWR